MKPLKQYRFDIYALLIFGLVVTVRFWHLVFNLNQIIFHSYGDGIKNYFTPLYYIKNDHGWHFSGMNYPYGEQLPFTDNQPIISWMLNVVDNHLFSIADYTVGIINGLMLLSIVLTAFFIYKILRFFRLPMGLAIWGGLILAFLSPQLDRIDVHFALGYGFFIPMVWWLLIKLRYSRKTIQWSIILFLTIAFQSLTHLYFLFINTLFVGTFLAIISFIDYKKDGHIRRSNVFGLGSLTVAIILVLALVKGLDKIPDRPQNPYGLETYTSSLQSLIYPARGPVHDLIEPGHIIGEGEAYLGILGIPFLIILIGVFAYTVIKKNRPVWIEGLPYESFLKTALISGIIIFMYAAGWLNALGLKYVNEVVPTLKQFRSLGRLAWTTYYLLTIVMMVCLTHLLIVKSRTYGKRWLEAAGILLLVIWSLEAHIHSTLLTNDIDNPNLFDKAHGGQDWNKLLSDKKIQTTEFQAILSLPMVILGPEKVQIQRGPEALRQSMFIASQTGLPIMDIMMSRTSVSQGLDLLELTTPSYVAKHRLNHCTNDPILIAQSVEALSPQEDDLIKRSQFLGELNGLKLYKILPEDLYKKEDINNIKSNCSSDVYVHFDFEDETGTAFAGQNGIDIKGNYELWIGSLPTDGIYEASFWLHIPADLKALPNVRFQKMNSQGQVLWEGQNDYPRSSLAQDGWIKIYWLCDRSAPDDIFKITIEAKEITIDEFMLRKSDENSCMTIGSDFLINNFKVNDAK